MLETDEHDRTVVLSASALLGSLLTILIIDPFLKIACSHSPLFLPPYLLSLPPDLYQVLCKFESWKQIQESQEFER